MRHLVLAAAGAATCLGMTGWDALAQGKRPPGAEGDNRCTVHDAAFPSERDVVVYSGARKRGFAICLERDEGQRVVVTVDRSRKLTLVGTSARRTCEDVTGRHIRIEIAKPGPTVSSCPAL